MEDSPHYVFHSTLAYNIYPILSNEARAAWQDYNEAVEWMLWSLGPFTLPKPDLCTFHDMGEFVPVAVRLCRGSSERQSWRETERRPDPTRWRSRQFSKSTATMAREVVDLFD